MIKFFSCVCASRKKGERLDWMYSAAAGQVDHEMYLLGKPVDKAVDPMAQENEEVGLNSLTPSVPQLDTFSNWLQPY